MRSISIALLASFALMGCRAALTSGLQVGDKAPGFSLPEVGGGEVALTDYTGVRPVLLFFHMAVG